MGVCMREGSAHGIHKHCFNGVSTASFAATYAALGASSTERGLYTDILGDFWLRLWHRRRFLCVLARYVHMGLCGHFGRYPPPLPLRK